MRTAVVLLALALVGGFVLIAPAEEASATPWNPCEVGGGGTPEACFEYIFNCIRFGICY